VVTTSSSKVIKKLWSCRLFLALNRDFTFFASSSSSSLCSCLAHFFSFQFVINDRHSGASKRERKPRMPKNKQALKCGEWVSGLIAKNVHTKEQKNNIKKMEIGRNINYLKNGTKSAPRHERCEWVSKREREREERCG
jgi:hypothetical protein